ncbi:dicarboxylate--CoA ligase PimA [Sphingomonas sp. Leaf412]|uniref:AMP-binding protein n=1 Tax=Sphingomonas sp. Leaf412 TaxID=1736370 RepID=UPI0006F379B2|nr:AMP-binding protein [Sphingomonas sp. Leaf412]KQT34804.1 dicarboxylate--CoA ligase PimA [Sphingomonas sp. Leaf412]
MTDPDWLHGYRHPVPWETAFPPESMVALFDDSVARFGARALIDFMARRYSYAEVADGARRVATGLAAMGYGKGDRIGLFLPNVPHYLAAYHGALRLGATVVNFSPLYSVDELVHQVEDSGTRVLFTLSATALLPNALAVLAKSSLERVIVGSVAGALPAGKSLFYRLFKGREVAARPDDARVTAFSALIANDGALPAAIIDPARDVALIQYTGGTTGTPKGAVLTHANVAANARQVASLDPHPDLPDRILGALPLFHVFANTCVMNRTIATGGEIVMLPRFEAGAALAALHRTKATALPGVPTMYQALLDHPGMAKTDFSGLRICISGGAALNADLKARWEEATHATLVEGYGLSESTGVLTVNPYEGVQKPGTIGQPLPGTRLRLVDKEDPTKPAPAGGPGEIVAKGPQVMAGYWNRPDADADTFADGWLRTGDVGTIDADGFVAIVDRLKDMIAVGGFKVFPSRIETVLHRHPAVREALVIGVPDAYSGERVRAYVTLEPEAVPVTGDALRDWVNPQVGKHERVDAVTVRDAMPKTMIGKLSRKDLIAEVRVLEGW